MEPDILLHLIAGTRGGPTRLQILSALDSGPLNANQLTTLLKLDYKTVRHHLEVLLENGLISVSEEKKYGELYRISGYASMRLKAFEKIMRRLGGAGRPL